MKEREAVRPDAGLVVTGARAAGKKQEARQSGESEEDPHPAGVLGKAGARVPASITALPYHRARDLRHDGGARPAAISGRRGTGTRRGEPAPRPFPGTSRPA